MTEKGWGSADFASVPTPAYVVSEEKFEKNLALLHSVEERTGAKMLMALKSFSMWSMFPIVEKYLSGTEASSVHEARLGAEIAGKEVHVFSPSYSKENIGEYLQYADHLVFNSFSQWKMLRDEIAKSGKKVSCGIRVNPEHSEVEISMYDPSAENSHFGVTRANFEANELDGIEGLHFHNLCEAGADALVRTLAAFEEKFGEFLPRMKWVNWGGGHHITRADYDVELLVRTILDFKKRYSHLDVYLEPGEAAVLNAGVLVGSVVELKKNNMDIAILDVSATCHMPDVLEMPYLPHILGAKPAEPGDKHIYKLAGPTCLTGDVIGYYSFGAPLAIGQKIILLNMALYTMVKNTTFNGVNLPSIAIQKRSGKIETIKSFGYEDFKNRLS